MQISNPYRIRRDGIGEGLLDLGSSLVAGFLRRVSRSKLLSSGGEQRLLESIEFGLEDIDVSLLMRIQIGNEEIPRIDVFLRCTEGRIPRGACSRQCP